LRGEGASGRRVLEPTPALDGLLGVVRRRADVAVRPRRLAEQGRRTGGEAGVPVPCGEGDRLRRLLDRIGGIAPG
jgi:hypothetical protein